MYFDLPPALMKKQVYNFMRLKFVFFLLRKKIYSIIKFIFWKTFDYLTASTLILRPFFANYLIKIVIRFLRVIKKFFDYLGFDYIVKRIINRYFDIKNKNKYTNSKFSSEMSYANQIDYENRLISISSSSSHIKKIHDDLIHRLSTRAD